MKAGLCRGLGSSDSIFVVHRPWSGVSKQSECKKVVIFLSIILNICDGAKKSGLVETVLLIKHNIFWVEKYKNNLKILHPSFILKACFPGL